MKSIKIFPLKVEPEQVVEVPFNSEILWFGLINEEPALAILVDNAYKAMSRKFVIYAVDKEILPRFNKTNFIGSFDYRSSETESQRVYVFEE